VGVTDPAQVATLQRAATTPCFAADEYARKKKAKYTEPLRNAPNILFLPIIAETFGGWNADAIQLFRDICKWHLQRDPTIDFNTKLNQLTQQLSVILQRCNARMILSRTKRIR
jgi:hypothetical protein